MKTFVFCASLRDGSPTINFLDGPNFDLTNFDLLCFLVCRDNPLTDIYGANVFDRYLAAEREANKERESEEKELMEVDKVVIER